MAKQTGDFKFKGTIADLCFYEMQGGYYVRRKSSLTGKRFQQDTAFAGSRKSSSRFGEGNRLASALYRSIRKDKRVYPLFCFLKTKSILLLKEGKSLREAEVILADYLVEFGLLDRVKTMARAQPKAVSSRKYRRSNAPLPFADPRTGFTRKKLPVLNTIHPPASSPFSHFVPHPAGRSAFPFALKEGSRWRSPPGKDHPDTLCTWLCSSPHGKAGDWDECFCSGVMPLARGWRWDIAAADRDKAPVAPVPF